MLTLHTHTTVTRNMPLGQSRKYTLARQTNVFQGLKSRHVPGRPQRNMYLNVMSTWIYIYIYIYILVTVSIYVIIYCFRRGKPESPNIWPNFATYGIINHATSTTSTFDRQLRTALVQRCVSANATELSQNTDAF